MRNEYEKRNNYLEFELARVNNKRMEDLLNRLKLITKEIKSMKEEVGDIAESVSNTFDYVEYAFPRAEECFEKTIGLLERTKISMESAKGATAALVMHRYKMADICNDTDDDEVQPF